MNHIGDRIKHVRINVYKLNQTELADAINEYTSKLKPKPTHKKFTQNTFTYLEAQSSIPSKKLLTLLNFLYDSKRVNTAWILMKNNKSLPLFITKIELNSDLIEIHSSLEKHSESILKGINDIRIIIDNTGSLS